jgi:ABC-type antimicrobial peptide transport system permease subunit
MALGATSGDIRRHVLREAAGHLIRGLALGLPVAWWASRSFATLLFRVRPTEPSIYNVVTVLLMAVGLLAAALPARKAALVDPIVSLRI